MVTNEERLSKLENAYEHLATKADLQAPQVDLLRERNSRFDKLQYAMLGGMGTILLTLILELIIGR